MTSTTYTQAQLDTLLAGKATPAQITTAVNAVVNGAPGALDTLAELATAFGNDANFAATVTNALAAKAPLASPTFTGTVAGVTKTHVGLGSVDNTADTAKPVSTAQAAAFAPSLNVLAVATTSVAPTIGAIQPYSLGGGAFAPTLPALSGLATKSTFVGIQKAVADTSTYGATITCAGGDTFDSGATSLTLSVPGELRILQVVTIGSTKYWKVVGGNTPVSGLDNRYTTTSYVKSALTATSESVRALANVVIDPTPPTITVQTGGSTPAGATSTLTGTIYKWDDTTNQCRYNGFRFEPRLWSGVNIYAPRPPHTTDSKELTSGGLIGSLWTIDFDFYGDAFEICVVDSTQVRIITDGKYAQDAPVLGGGSGNFFFIKVQYSTTAYRRVRIETGLNAANSLPGGWVHGIKFKTGQAHYPPSMPNTKRLALVHDSYGAGGLPTTADLRGYSAFLSRILGFTDYMNHCISGSGFTVGSTGNSQKYAPRIDDLVAAQPDYLIIMTSVNDYNQRATTLPAEAASFYAACKSQLPNTRILAVGAVGMVQSNNDALNAVLAPIAATAGIEFLDTTGWAANLPAGLIGSDNYHPTVDGHQWIARRLGAAIAPIWQLPR